MKKSILLIIACFYLIGAHAAYLKDVPMTLTQPDGTVLHCYASGDEFFNYLHDANGFTIMQHPQTGFYVYADKRDGNLVATEFVAGRVDPASKNLSPFNLISPQEWMARRQAWEVHDERPQNRDYIPNHGTLNNISIFIRFSDDEELTNSYSAIDNMFNNVSEGAISMRSYFRAASYGAIEIPTTFYPGHNGDAIISYQDTYPRSYFEPYNESTNTNGYQDDDERTEREFSLLERAVNYINANYPIPTNLDIDYDDDGYVDNVCFIVKGGVGAWSSLLWPHKWALYDRSVYINGKRVWTFNFQLADGAGYFETTVMCHEMNHSLGAPDLYHYYNGTNLSPVGSWDLMENNANPPQHCGAYMKMKYGHWIDEIPEITQAGIYTLNPISSATPTNVAYKIQSEDPNQFYVLEYRDKTSLFETALPGSGLLIYRIDTRFDGNASYNPSNGIYDEVYIFRPGGSTSTNGTLSSAHFSSNVGRTEFSASTSAYPFFTDGTIDNNFRIYDISSAGNTISFTFGTSECDPPTHLVATVVNDNVSLSWDAAVNAVSYNIYRNGTLIGNSSGTTYTDSNVGYGIFSYFLKSVDSSGLPSIPSETATVTIMPEGSITVGDGSSATDDFLPSYSYYKFSLTQQIYTSAELGESGLITSIAFYNAGAEKTRTYDFYLKHTTKDSFTNAKDWVTVSDADKVFSGSVTMAADAWTFINFSSPFVYDGTSNVVLVADDNTGSYTNSPHMSCRVFTATNQALYAYNDNTNFNPLSPPTSSSSYNAVLSSKNQIILAKEPLGDCVMPTQLTATEVGPDFAVLSWNENGTATEWVVACGNRTVIANTNEEFMLDGLDPETEYTIMVRPSCDENLFSMAITITTIEACPIPVDVEVSNITGKAATMTWTGYNDSYNVQIGIPAFMIIENFDNGIPSDWTNDDSYPWTVVDGHMQSGNAGVSSSTSSISVTVTYPTDGTISFDFWSRGEGQDSNDWDNSNFYIDNEQMFRYAAHDEWESYSGTVTAGTHTFKWVYKKDNSVNPTGDCFIVDNVVMASYDITWNNPIAVEGAEYTFIGLTPETSYCVKVQGVCDETETEWSETVVFTTSEVIAIDQTVALLEGWNWWSTNLDITLDQLKDALAAVVGTNGTAVIKSQGGTITYQNGIWRPATLTFDIRNMYEIYVNSNCEITLSGTQVNPSEYEITIHNGVNWIGFLPNESLTLDEAFGSFPVVGDVVKSKGGSATYDGSIWRGSLTNGELQPGQGYIYKSAATENRTIVFPTGAK